MHQATQSTILLLSDPLVCEGMRLMLEDMQFTVISANNPTELKNNIATHSTCPELLIFSLMLNNKPSIELVRNLRHQFDAVIPAILLSGDNQTHPLLITDNNITVLPEQIKPQALRQRIIGITKNQSLSNTTEN